jgi:uncharacterized membrane protein
MKWYQIALRQVLSGIIFFLLPIMLLFFILRKAIGLIEQIFRPFQRFIPDTSILGIGLLHLVSLLIILLVCYLAGILSEQKSIKSILSKIEENILVFIPGYSMIRSRAGHTLGESDENMRTVLVKEAKTWRPGIEVDRLADGYSSIFLPTPPSAKSGQLKFVHETDMKELNISVRQLMKLVRKYGKGSAAWMDEATRLEKLKV